MKKIRENNHKVYQVDLVSCSLDIYADSFDFNRDLIYFKRHNEKIAILGFDDVLKISLFSDNGKDYDIVFANSHYYSVHER